MNRERERSRNNYLVMKDGDLFGGRISQKIILTMDLIEDQYLDGGL
jgi:hypothetical protein